MPKKSEDKRYVFLRKVGYMTTAASEAGVLIGGGVWFGAWLDQRFSSTPGFLLGLLGLGLAISTYRAWYYIQRVVALDRSEDHRQ